MRRMYSEKQIKELARSEIQTGNLAIDGDLSVSGDVEVSGETVFNNDVAVNGNLTGDSIIENMSGYSYAAQTGSFTMSDSYVSACKNGNKLTLVVAGVFTPTSSFSGYISIGDFTIPQNIGALLVPLSIGGLTYVLDVKSAEMFSSISSSVAVKYRTDKVNNTKLTILLDAQNVVANTDYVFRYEVTFLLSENLTPTE